MPLPRRADGGLDKVLHSVVLDAAKALENIDDLLALPLELLRILDVLILAAAAHAKQLALGRDTQRRRLGNCLGAHPCP